MNSRSSGGWLEAFFTGKGFYIVLFLCAAVIGVSAWMLAAGNGTMEEAVPVSNTDNRKVETVYLPPKKDLIPTMEDAVREATEALSGEPEQEEAVEVFQEESAPVNPNYAWPLTGEIARYHDAQKLVYDPTLQDWRTHEGIDILAPLGETVTAAHAGTVQSVRRDSLFGVVVTVSHGDGVCTVYANLAEEPAVHVGDWVEPGDVIGAVGSSALREIGQESHLHFAVMVNGVNQNPLDYLPA